MALNLANIKALLDTQKTEILTSINSTLTQLQSEVLDLKTSINTVKESTSNNAQDILTLKQQIAQLSEDNVKLHNTLDDQVNRSYRKTLIFKNINEIEGQHESWDATEEIIASIISETSNEHPNTIKK